ncbi:DMT family transporter [Paragemmobacter straminiformis]|uniref:EamA family transporter n=1 Tax=Paragemmobacter straminiformis TaxID=2045119 RepID=A0A842I8B1_9RHOB|nr:EamA family transporter [Gemmobacter straminiformis]MBC2835869.1 EamA family transporter [Gemmobacter straminiformis]
MTALSPPIRRESAKGVAFLVAGVAVFSMQDLILKLLSGEYPLHQAMVLRSLTAIPFLLALVHYEAGLKSLFTPGTLAMIRRGVIMFLAYTCYYIALPALPMATTVALYFSAPLFITMLSVLMLGEHVGPRRWLALVAGFVGVVIMVRPTGAVFEWAALLPVFSGFAYALSMISARRLGTTESAAALAFWGNAVFLAAALVLSAILGTGSYGTEVHPSLAFLLRGWAMPTAFDLMLMMSCGVIAAVGLTLLTQAYRIAEASVVTPFEYTGMIWSVIYGWVFWRQWPDLTAWGGISIIIGAGLYVLWRENAANSQPG